MHNMTQRPNRRPKLYLPAFLSPPCAAAADRQAPSPFPVSAPALRRMLAEMMD
jgi:hypothetical protein